MRLAYGCNRLCSIFLIFSFFRGLCGEVLKPKLENRSTEEMARLQYAGETKGA